MSLFHFTTNEISLFKNLIYSLKEIMIETNIQFSETGIKICKMNTISSICCFVDLPTEILNRELNSYECIYPSDKPLVVGINLLHFAKILRTIASGNNILHLLVDESNKNVLKIKVQTTNRLVVSNYTMNFIEVNEEKMSLPDGVEFDKIIEIEAKYFQKQIKDIYNLESSYVDIKSYKKQLIITGTGGYMTRETIIEEGSENTINILQTNDQICQGKYSTKDLLAVSRFIYLSDKFILKFKNDIPLIVSIEIKDLGEIMLIVALQNKFEINRK